MLSLEDYKALEERTPANAKRLLAAAAQLSTNKGCGAETGRARLVFANEAREDSLNWQEQDRKMAQRINHLLSETQQEPFSGVGKPERLKHALSELWSRRITDKHCMVYRVEGEELQIAKLRFHY